MNSKSLLFFMILSFLLILAVGCKKDENVTPTIPIETDMLPTMVKDSMDQEDPNRIDTMTTNVAERFAFEILEVKSPNEIIVWLLDGNMTIAEFEAIELPQGWIKNQPREGLVDGAAFARSPDALLEGEFTYQEHFGYQWRHVATVIESNIALDDQGLLTGTYITKYHTLLFSAGRTLELLVSPEGERFVLLTRDAGRTSDIPTIPNAWQRYDTLIQEDWVVKLPSPTLNIRADNEDSYQGPIGVTTPINNQTDEEAQEETIYETTLAQLDPLDKGGRWLALGIKEIQELEFLPNVAKDGLSNFLHTLAMNPSQRCETTIHEQVFSNLENAPDAVVSIIRNTITRVCSSLNYHEGYWVLNNEGTAVEVINDVHVDAATNRITVYAQARMNGQVLSPAQVGPGEITAHITGDSVGFHPNAVYLNRSGKELMEADGTGAWWVKHAWEVDGEGYYNWELGRLEKEYGDGLWVTCELLEDGLTMKIGDLDNSHGGAFNSRQPILTTMPITFQVNSNISGNSSVLIFDCTEEVSAFDGLARSCPK